MSDDYSDLIARGDEKDTTPTPAASDNYSDLLARGNEVEAPSPQITAKKSGIVRNLAMGALSGATKIGSTILWPVDKVWHAFNSEHPDPAERRADIQQFFGQHADPNSLAFKGGQLGGMVAGTAGAGPAMGGIAEAAGASAPVVSALSTGGLSLGGGTTGSVLGNAALRVGSGAAVGGASAGLVNPETAGTGATIGAATPGAAWLLGMAGKGLGYTVGKGTKTLLGGVTGTGGDAIEAAYQAGVKGDRSFINNMRGNVPFSDIVDQAKDALSKMRDARGAAYRSGMADVSSDRTVLDMQPILSAVSSAQERFGSFHGEVVNENASNAISKVADKVNDWVSKEPEVFHTPEGLDKLKQWVGGELENARPGTQTDAALKGIYNSIKGSIADQAPTYAKTMADYGAASEQLSEISRTLSLNPKASVDTSVRKLQSILRNNVTTNYGNRVASIDALENQGGAHLRSALAGQSMSSVWPRGIAGAIDAAAAIPAAIHNPMLLAGGVVSSPRLVGEAAYGLGRLGGAVSGGVGAAPFNNLAPLIGSQQSFPPQTVSEILRLNHLNAARNPENTP